MTSQPKTCLTPEEYPATERQGEFRIEHYTKEADGPGTLSGHRSPGDVVELACVECALKLREVYEKVSLPPGDLKEGGILWA